MNSPAAAIIKIISARAGAIQPTPPVRYMSEYLQEHIVAREARLRA
jgi:hypothetical protein